MGSVNFKQVVSVDEKQKDNFKSLRSSVSSEPVSMDAPIVSNEQKVLLRESWCTLQEDIARVGVVTFLRLFETHPDFQETFLPFRGLVNKDMENSAILKSHALRVMATVDKCLTRLDSPEKLDDLLQGLGHRHISYNVKIDYVDEMGVQFIKAIEPKFGSSWSPEMEMAWKKLFDLMTYHMKRGIIHK